MGHGDVPGRDRREHQRPRPVGRRRPRVHACARRRGPALSCATCSVCGSPSCSSDWASRSPSPLVADYTTTMVARDAARRCRHAAVLVQQSLTIPLQAHLRFGWVAAFQLLFLLGVAVEAVVLVVAGAGLLPFFALWIPITLVSARDDAEDRRRARRACCPRSTAGVARDAARDPALLGRGRARRYSTSASHRS